MGANPASDFDFELQQKIKCSSCSKVRLTGIKYSNLTLNIAQTDVPSIENCFRGFFEEESISFNCPNCKISCRATKYQF
jgi:uncharacterized UBP type Zn finger protein